MPKIIVKVQPIKSTSGAARYLKYVAKRDGVDKTVNESVVIDGPTQNQIDCINDLIKMSPDSKITYEYADYIDNPTKQNASALIEVIMENNPDVFEGREGYINYIATRPRVEKMGEHGLFGMDDKISLEKVKNEMQGISSTVWTCIISLRREDAERLGYDNASAWRDLIRSKHFDMANVFKISDEDYVWYASFHNEGHHPHVHMVVYNKHNSKGNLSEEGIEKIKSMIVSEVFRDEMHHLYVAKTTARDRLSEESKKKVSELVDRIKETDYQESEIALRLIEFARKLKSVKGKKVYSYLPKKLKKEVDEIVKLISKEENIDKLYEEWCKVKSEIDGAYHDKETEPIPLWENNEFKKIKNAVIKEADRLGDGRIFDLPQDMDKTDDKDDTLPEDDEEPDEEEKEIREQTEQQDNGLKIEAGLSAFNLVYRLSSIIEDDIDKRVDGFSKTIVDAKERKKTIQKQQSLGIKMG